jgi:aspartate-semialdehyde dehydrogenase
LAREYCVAVLGATGAVGTEMVRLLHERNFPISKLKVLASERSAGRWISFGDDALAVEVLNADNLRGVDIALGATDASLARQWAPILQAQGSVFIDNSSAFRMDPSVPLVVPEVNAEDLEHHPGIVANPNCSTILMVLAVWPLHKIRPIKRLVISTYQAASGAGAAGMAELQQQTQDVLDGRPAKPEIFPHPIAFNLFPHNSAIGEDFYCEEEKKMILETRKLFHEDHLPITATCIRVSVLRAHSESINIEFETPFPVAEARELLAKAPGIRLVEDWGRNYFPMPNEASDQDDVLVGRIRQDLSCPNALELWLCGDQIRKGAALNAVQIAECLCGRFI